MVRVMEVVALRPRKKPLERAGGERVPAVRVDRLNDSDRQPNEEDDGVDAEADACVRVSVENVRRAHTHAQGTEACEGLRRACPRTREESARQVDHAILQRAVYVWGRSRDREGLRHDKKGRETMQGGTNERTHRTSRIRRRRRRGL